MLLLLPGATAFAAATCADTTSLTASLTDLTIGGAAATTTVSGTFADGDSLTFQVTFGGGSGTGAVTVTASPGGVDNGKGGSRTSSGAIGFTASASGSYTFQYTADGGAGDTVAIDFSATCASGGSTSGSSTFSPDRLVDIVNDSGLAEDTLDFIESLPVGDSAANISQAPPILIDVPGALGPPPSGQPENGTAPGPESPAAPKESDKCEKLEEAYEKASFNYSAAASYEDTVVVTELGGDVGYRETDLQRQIGQAKAIIDDFRAERDSIAARPSPGKLKQIGQVIADVKRKIDEINRRLRSLKRSRAARLEPFLAALGAAEDALKKAGCPTSAAQPKKSENESRAAPPGHAGSLAGMQGIGLARPTAALGFASPVAASSAAAVPAALTTMRHRFAGGSVWLRPFGSLFDDGTAGASASGSSRGLQVGGDIRIGENTAVGAFFGYRGAQADMSGISQSLDLDALGGGVFISTRFDKRFRATGLFFYEHGANDFRSGTTTANFGTDRFAVAGHVSGGWHVGAFTVTPGAGLFYQTVQRHSFDDSAGTAHASNALNTGSLSGNVKVTYDGFVRPWPDLWPGLLSIQPYVATAGTWNFKDATNFTPTMGVVVPDDNRLTLSLSGGLAASFADGSSLSLGISGGGLGGDVHSVSFSAGGSVPLAALGIGVGDAGRVGLSFAGSAAGSMSGLLGLNMPLN